MTRHDMETTLISLLKDHGADQIGIFGSYARGEAKPDSDLDILVHFRTRKSLLTLVKYQERIDRSSGHSR